MRVAALYDVHGNLPALEAVLDEVAASGVDLVVVGGDVIPGPMPLECVRALLDLDVPARFVRGNGEREVLALAEGAGSSLPEPVQEALLWTARQLGPEERRALASWPLTVTLETAVGEVLFCHATPRDDNEIFTPLTPEERMRAVFDAVDEPLVVCGHTHVQFERTVGATRVVNAGSVGMPFGEPGGYWLLIDDEGVATRRTGYDLEAAARRIRATGYPQAAGFAEGNVLHPPREAEMLEALERAAVR